MPLTDDQKKHLLIGGGISALALVGGYMLFGRRRASAATLPSRADERLDRQRRHHRHEQGRPDEIDEVEVENERGEYGRRHHHRHHEGHDHG
jgi:hypothetical protein